MEINRIKVVLKAFLIFTLASFFSSCEYLEIVNCSNCYSDPPSETLIYVKINENYTNFENAEINIYDGDYDDNILHYSFNAKRSSDTPIQLPIDKKYTFTATYYIDGKTYTVFDIAIIDISLFQ